MRGLALACVLALAGCAAVPREPTVIEVLPSGYRVEGRTLATAAELRHYVVAQKVREVRVVALMDTSLVRVQETHAALREAGVAVAAAR
jgi:hypothetical protein